MAGTGLAAVLLAAFLAPQFLGSSEDPARRILDQAPDTAPGWTRTELDTAQDEVAYSLALTARILRKGERAAVHQVFGEKLPQVISGSFRKAIHTNQGDQG